VEIADGDGEEAVHRRGEETEVSHRFLSLPKEGQSLGTDFQRHTRNVMLKKNLCSQTVHTEADTDLNYSLISLIFNQVWVGVPSKIAAVFLQNLLKFFHESNNKPRHMVLSETLRSKYVKIYNFWCGGHNLNLYSLELCIEKCRVLKFLLCRYFISLDYITVYNTYLQNSINLVKFISLRQS
jgi:hypothetical protein